MLLNTNVIIVTLWNKGSIDEENTDDSSMYYFITDLHSKVTSNVGWRTDSGRVQSESNICPPTLKYILNISGTNPEISQWNTN